MPATSNKNKKPLTPLQKLVVETIGGTLGVRARVLDGGRAIGRQLFLRWRYTVIALVVREGHMRGELLNTSEIAEKASIDRKAAERILKRLSKVGLIRSEEIGREMKHFIPADRFDRADMLPAYIGMAAYLIALGDHMKTVVAGLDDELKAKIAHMVEVTTFLSLCLADVVDMTADVVEVTMLLC